MKILKNIAAALMMLLGVWLFGFALFCAFAIWAPPQDQNRKTDAIIVLTGGTNRVQESLGLFAQKKAHHLFISGVHKDVTKDQILALWHGQAPLPACCLTLGYEASTTEENAIETRRWIKENNIRSIRLLTGNYHMARAALEFRHMLPGISVYIHPVWQPDLNIHTRRFWNLMFLEYHKTLYRIPRFLIPA